MRWEGRERWKKTIWELRKLLYWAMVWWILFQSNSTDGKRTFEYDTKVKGHGNLNCVVFGNFTCCVFVSLVRREEGLLQNFSLHLHIPSVSIAEKETLHSTQFVSVEFVFR